MTSSAASVGAQETAEVSASASVAAHRQDTTVVTIASPEPSHPLTTAGASTRAHHTTPVASRRSQRRIVKPDRLDVSKLQAESATSSAPKRRRAEAASQPESDASASRSRLRRKAAEHLGQLSDGKDAPPRRPSRGKEKGTTTASPDAGDAGEWTPTEEEALTDALAGMGKRTRKGGEITVPDDTPTESNSRSPPTCPPRPRD